MKVMYNFVAANRVRQSVCLKNQTEQMDNHFVTFIKFVLTYNLYHYLLYHYLQAYTVRPYI